jgi:putative flippase GtrA
VETSQRRRAHHALRSRANWVQLGKFCVVGGIGYVINLCVYSLLLYWVHYLLAATCSFLVAATSNYYLNRRWTFHDRHRHIGVQGLQFLVVSAVALGANLFVLHLLIRAGAHEKGAQALAIIVATPLNFLGNRLWSFRTIR